MSHARPAPLARRLLALALAYLLLVGSVPAALAQDGSKKSDARARGEKAGPRPKGEKSGAGKGDRPAPQGINVWTTNGPENFAVVGDLVIEADTPSTLYAATDTGVYKSADAAATWALLSNGIPTNSFSKLAIDPTNNAGAPATVFAANPGTITTRGLYRSTDGGQSWALSTTGLPGTGAVSDVAIDPSTPSTVYVGLPNNGVYKSTDGGGNWTVSTAGITTGASLSGFTEIVVDPLSPQVVYAGVISTNNGVRGLWKTADGGANWTRIGAATFVNGATALAPLTVYPDPLNAGFVFAATSGTGTSELYRSTDGGANWNASSTGLTDKNIRQLARDAAGTLYCLTRTGLFTSADNGANWAAAPQSGLDDLHASFAPHPSDANTVYVGAAATGVFKTTNAGAIWARASEGFQGTADFYYDVIIDPSNSNVLYAASDSGLFKSTDGGQSWRPKSRNLAADGLILSVAVDPTDSNKVYAGTGGFGLFRSTDGGETWADVGAGLTDFDNEDVIVDPSNPQIVYVTDSGTGVRRSTDGGLNFTASNTGIEFHQVFDIDFDPTDPAVLFAAVANGGATRDGVYKSSDSGATWTRFGGVVSGERFFSLAIDPTDPRVIYAAGDAAYKTTDGGASWALLNTASASSFESVAIDPSNRMRVYAGNRDGEVYQSADGGQNFAVLGAGLPADEIYAMAVSPSGHKLYVTAGGSGVYEYQIVTSGTFIVNSTLDAADANTGDGLCDDGAGNCTLRAAIQQANATAGADSIQFDIPGAGVHTISLAAALPSITEAATVDGYTQPGSSPNALPVGNNAALRIRLDGQPLHVAASNSTVRGLSLTNSGITLNGASNATIEGNFVGLDPAGADGNGQGIEIIGGSNNLVGTTGAAGRNVISGSAGAGITLDSTTGNTVRNNYVGTNPSGTAAVANATQGILLRQSSNNTVGGKSAAARNVVSGNGGANIQVGGGASAAAGNLIRGNYVGTNAAGTSALGGLVGVQILNNAPNTVVGGTEAGAGNVVSGNQSNGVEVASAGNVIQGNLIGTDAGGTAAVPNGLDGVYSEGNNQIGGAAAGAGNTIAFNDGAGVAVVSVTGVLISGNSIHSNGALGIDLNLDGVTANDPAPDADAGGNNLQNFPALATASATGNSTMVTGALTSAPNTQYAVEFFSSASCDPSGNGEGRTFLGSANVTTDGAGSASINATLPRASFMGEAVTATATDPANNTSEFSACVTVSSPDLVVTTTADAGAGSLRQAILDANTVAGAQTIVFSIPGAGPHVITLSSALPVITDPVVLDAATEPDYAVGAPAVELRGGGTVPTGFDITAGSSTVRGFVMNGFSNRAVYLSAGGGNKVQANFIGTNAAGTAAGPNPNHVGVSIDGSPANLIGGDEAGERNVISANSNNGVLVAGAGSNGNNITGNYIGTDKAGAADLGNGAWGVFTDSTAGGSLSVGGVGTGEGNVIAGNGLGQIHIGKGNSTVRGNLVGTNAAGTACLADDSAGVQVQNAANNTIGGDDDDDGTADGVVRARNVIACSQPGIDILGGSVANNSDNNVVQGNLIGTDITGALDFGNTLAGIQIRNGDVNGTLIGGTAAGAGNLVAFSKRQSGIVGGSGVRVSGTRVAGNLISGNSIRSNARLGIDLGADDAVSANDAADADAGPNDLQNFPAVTSVTNNAGNTTIAGTLNSHANKTFRVEVFHSAGCDPLGNGQGDVFVGSQNVTTAGNDAAFSLTVPQLPAGSFVTATAVYTDAAAAGTAVTGDTSEFSACVATPAAATPLTVTNTNDSGAGSLRQAILNANATPNGATPDLIDFNIPGAGPHTIAPTTALPDITDPVRIDGYTQPGASTNTLAVGSDAVLLVEIDGSGQPTDLFHLLSDNNVVRGLVINRAPFDGIQLGSGSDGNVIEGNFIGTDPTGTIARPNNRFGVSLYFFPASNNVIGGTTPAARNVISGNGQGVVIGSAGSTGNVVRGNYIGTTASGDALLPNISRGVFVGDGATNNLIGGATAADRNVISGNDGTGVFINGSGVTNNVVRGNYIGLNAAGTATLRNFGHGVDVGGGSATGNAILSNLISGNQSLGINLDNSGITPNDDDDPDAGANNLQNFPVINSAVKNGGNTTVQGTLNSTPSTSGFVIEFFTSPSCDPSGNGEGARLLGSITVNTDANGDAAFNQTFPLNTAAGEAATATATDPAGNTSEFSPCRTILGTAQTFTVTTTADSGAGSLRQAITDANANNLATDTIAFSIPGAGPHTIAPASALPTVTDPVLIDGYTQGDSTPADTTDDAVENTLASGTNAVIKIELNGAGAGAGVNGLNLADTASGSTVRGLAINRFTRDGISLSGSDNNTISGNFIGTDTAGLADLGNGSVGIESEFFTNSNNNTIGGTSPAARNVISGNGGSGVEFSTSTGNAIRGNLIGLGADGATAVGNGGGGVILGSFTSANFVGGDDAADGAVDGVVHARNVISGNGGSGVFLGGAGFGGAIVQGNHIGTNAAGTAARPNQNGIDTNLAHGTTVGGTAPGAGNLISGNTFQGIGLGNTNGFFIRGNRIGTAADGTTALGNGANGVFFIANSSNVEIGGTETGQGNVIAFNGGDGVQIETGTNNSVRSNSIHSNGTTAAHLGIDLGTDGVDANDAGDGDTGANTLQNFPVISSSTGSAGQSTIQGTLNSTAATTLRVEFFSAPACDAAGNGEGAIFLGAQDVTTDAAGSASFTAVLPVGTTAGHAVTATATGPAGTSEFSACATVTTGAMTFTVTNTGDAGAGSLRQAVTDANANPGTDTIAFNIPGAGVQTINLLSALPTVTQPVTIDGSTQPGYAGSPLVELNGAGAGAGASGLTITAGASTVRALVINRFAANGIVLQTNGSNTVEGCYIGTDAAGTSDLGNTADGISINASANNQIGGATATPGAGAGNVISGNNSDGVMIQGATASGNVLRGNLIGTNAAGTAALGNNAGVFISNAPSNTIGGTTAQARNVISGNAAQGINISGEAADSIVIAGNYIGTDVTGASDVGNGNDGVRITVGPDNSVIGGLTATPGAAPGNVISGNNEEGIAIDNVATTGHQILGNIVGLSAEGSAPVRNESDGILLIESSANVIGGSDPQARNVISGNNQGAGDRGIEITGNNADNNLVAGNYIGTDITGTVDLGNFDDGVLISGGDTNTVGGPTATPGQAPGNVISGNGGDGVETNGTGNLVRGNIVGLNAAGTAAIPNARGYFLNAGTGNFLGGPTADLRNVVSGNTGHGVQLDEGQLGVSDNNTVQSNYIGTDITGTVDLGNGGDGISLPSADVVAIGGATATPGTAPGNVISGNAGDGIELFTTSVTVVGNLIGLKANGTEALPNGGHGVHIPCGDTNTVGGAAANERNVISANGGNGVFVTCGNTGNATGNAVRGNYIGTDVTGTADLGNALAGVRIEGFANNHAVGGAAAGAGNLISGNGTHGVHIGTPNGINAQANLTTIQGNLIGTQAGGTAALPNGGDGVFVSQFNPANANNQIGGAGAGEANTIAFNGANGVNVANNVTRNRVSANSIHSNALLGINLGPAGVTPNDGGDPDGGANNLQNFPVMTGAVSTGPATTAVSGTLNSTASTTFTVELFASAACDASGSGEGARFLGSTQLTTDASGNGSFDTTLNSATAAGEFITATATSAATNDTSEFSVCRPAGNVINWVNAAGGNWNTAANWVDGAATSRVPTAHDAVRITLDGTYTVNLDVDAAVASLTLGGATGAQTLSLVTNRLTLNGASTTGANGVVLLGGGNAALQGPGPLSIGGALNWADGSLSVGTTNVAAAGTVNASGAPAKGLTGAFNNSGAFNFAGTGNINFTSGTFTNLAGALFDIKTDAQFVDSDGTGTPASFANAGTLRKSAGAGAASINLIPLTNTGALEVQTGALDFSRAFNNNGGVSVSPGASLNAGGGGASAGDFALAGALNFTAGTHVFDDGVDVTGAGAVGVSINAILTAGDAAADVIDINNLSLNGGTVNGPGALNVGGVLSWTEGAAAATGALNVAPGATANLSGASLKTLAGVLNNAGTFNFAGAGDLRFTSGTLTNLAGATFDIQTDAQIVDSDGLGTAASFVNAGTLRKSAGAGTALFNLVALINAGAVEAQTGTLGLNHTFTQTAGSVFLGGGNISSANTFNLQGGELRGTGQLAGNVSNTGGTVRPGASPGCLNIGGNYEQGPGGALDVEIGGATACAQFDRLAVTGAATLDGVLNLTLTGGFNPAGGATFAVLTYGSRAGTFATVNGPFTTSYNANDLTVVKTANAAQTYTVTTTADSGAGSLRQAILDANANAGAADAIQFNIAGAGVQTIAPTSPLPVVTDPVLIDGYTQPGASANTLAAGSDAVLLVELDGTNAGAGFVPGLTITAGASTVRGLVINDFQGAGIHVQGGTGPHVIAGNFVGTNAAGTSAQPNGRGVILEVVGGTLVGGNTPAARNVISGNTGDGIFINGSDGNAVRGNYVGTSASGSAALGNGADGIAITIGSNNQIGGPAAADRNVVSGNAGRGVAIRDSASAGNAIRGNFVGTDATGTSDLGNTQEGVRVESASSNTVGGTGAGERNVISGNNAEGVVIINATAGGNAVRGNYIGTDATGAGILGNASRGVLIQDAPNNFIGGTAAGSGNLVSGNGGGGILVSDSGGAVEATGNSVQGNLVGTDAAGTAALGNGGIGVQIFNTNDNAVGGASAGAANTIAFNALGGVIVSSGTGNAVLSNAIHSNGTSPAHLGIDLGTDGVTANDAGDADSGANNLQNFPALASATTAGGTTTVQGALNSAAATAFRVEFFSSPACDAAGSGEGRTFLGSQDVTTDASGNTAINATLAAATTVGESVTATATDPAGNTSEFSACRSVTAPGAATDVSWTNAAGGDWHTAANWQDGTGASRVPSANDNVFITLAGNYTVTMSADARPASLTLGDGASAQTLNTGTFTLTLANASTVRANAVLNLSGTLSGAGALEVFGTLNHNGNAAAGAGAINVRPGGGVNFGGTQPRLARTLNNEGTANYNPASSMILNGAAFNNLAGSIFNVAAEKVLAQQGAASTFVNRGTVRKAAGAGETEFNLPFDNLGTVDLQSGSLRFSAGGASSGAFNGAAGTVLKLASHDLQAGSSVAAAAVEFSGANGTVAGTYNVTGTTTAGGTTNFTGNVQSVGQTLNVTGTASFNSNAVTAQNVNITGSVNGSADLSPTAAGTMNLSGALDGTGATNVAAGATLNLQGTQPRLSRAVNNLGTTNFAATSSMVFSGATFNNQPGATFNVQSDALLFQLGAAATFNNAGMLRKLTGAGDAEFRLAFNNSGAVDLQSGGLDLSGSGASTGTFTAAAGTQLKLNAHNLQAASVVNAVTLSLSGATTVAGTFNVSQTTNVNAGTATFTGNVQSVGQTLNVAGAAHFNSNAVSAPSVNVTGTLGGTANVGPAAPGALDLNGGTLAGAGATDIPAGATLILRGTQPTLSRTVNNSGTTDYAVTSSMVFAGGAFNNLPGATFNVNSETLLFELGAPSAFTNAGTVRKAAGAGAAEFRLAFDNNGTVDLQSGELNFSARGTSAGAFNGAAGTTLRLAGQTLQPAATVAAPTVFLSGATAFAGTLNATTTTNVGGTATFTGNVQSVGQTLNVTGAATFNSNNVAAQTVNVTGTLSGSADVAVPAGGTFNLTGGTLAAGGTTTIPATATLNLGGAQPTVARTVNNSGTANYAPASGMVFNGATFNNLAGGVFNVQSDTVLLQAGAGATFNNSGSLRKETGAAAAEFRLGFANAGTVTAASGLLHFSVGNYTQTAGETVLNGGNVQTTGLLDVQGGVLRGAGTITGNVRNAAALRPGLSPGCMIVNGDYEQTPAATLDIEIGGATACTQYDRLAVTGAATLAGTLAATLVNGFVPALNQQFQILTFASRTGTFSAVTGPLAAQYNATDVTVANATPSSTLAVTNTNDAGTGSLRQAILDSNAQTGAQTITFQIPGANVQTIALLSPLPTITEAVTIDGASQPGYAGTPLIELNGAGAGAGTSGLTLTAGNSTVRALVVNRFAGNGIVLQTNGGNTVAGCYVGTDAAGATDLGNGQIGILVSSAGNTVGGTSAGAGNVVSGNGNAGILISGAAATGNAMQGNLVGTNAAGTAAVANTFNGVQINNSASGNTVGGTTAAARNVISGNGLNGVSVQASGNTVQGNFVGTNADGASALPNAANGLIVNSAGNNQIGGTAAGAGNVVSGNAGGGVSLEINSTGNVVRGNLVGTNAAGTAALPNGSAGVSIAFGSNANTVGGDDDDDGAADGAVAARNVISANGGVGLSIQSATGNAVQGNYIGVAADGLTAAGNGGVGVFVGAGGNQIGGAAAGAGNLIAFNTQGVQVGSGAAGNAIRANLIHSNNSLGIDLQPAGVTANDAGDGDAGPNNLQNFPALTSAVAAGGATQITGTLNSTANATFAVEFFTNAACDPSGHGEGQTLLGSANVTTDAAGNATLSFTLPAALPLGQSVTATATDAAGNTSEFSACRAVTGPPPATFTISGTVRDISNFPVSGVLMTLSGAASATTTTDAAGNYSFPNLAGGAGYTVTPSHANFSFTPANRTYNNLSADQTAQNFTTTPNPGTVQFSAASYSGTESGGGILVSVTRTGNTSGAATVNYADTPGTATSADYSGGSGSVTFAAGEATKNFTAGVANDALDEPDESFALALSVGSGNVVLGAQSTATVTITDDDAAPSVSVGDVTLAEGNSGQSNAVFNINLSAASGQAVTVNFATADGTAASASGDYAAQSGTATLPAGTTTFPVSVPVNGDTAVEPDETFFLNLASPANASIGDAQGQATITNDDAAQTFSVTGRVTSSANNQPLANVTVTISGGQSGTTQTDANGDYSFANLAGGGTYTVTPSLANFSFAPLSRTFDNLQANQTADFAGGLANVTVSGRITDEDAQPVGGVTVALVAPISDDAEQPLSTTQTDANGNYSFTAPVGGTYVVRPARAGVVFTPPAHVFRNATGNRTADFRALDAFTISGNLSDLVAPGAKAARAQAAAEAGNVVVTLSGTRSGTTLTDAAGNYTFTNLPLGGTYRVTPQNPFNLFDPPFVAFPDLGGNGTADFGADANPNPTPTPPVRDDFSGPARDADRFSLGTLTQPPGATDPLVTVEQRAGKLVITPRTNFTGLSFNGYVTTRSIDFTNATASIAVDQIATGGAQTIFSVGRDDQNFFRFVAQEQEVATASAAPSAGGDKSNAAPRNTLQQLLLQVRAAGVFNSLTIPYDPVAHKYWRFRHDAAASPFPALFFEASPTGADGTWSVLRIVPVAGAVGSLATEISAGTAGAVASPGRAIFDDLNVVPPQTAVAVGAYRLAETTLSVAEGAGSFRLRVRRTGVLAGESTVDVASEPFDNRPCSTTDGKARPRCDFSTTFARLRFAAGESEKFVTVFLTDDVYAEGDETFRLALGNASGGFSIDAAVANVTIRDDDQPGARNPINDAEFFVRQQYLDFLSREPDAGGFEAWTGVLRRCAFEGHFGPGKSNSDPNCDRLLVSSSFYRSTEFHERGFFAYRFYEVALGRRPTYDEFLSDMQRLSGFQTAAEQEANKVAFVKEFMARGGFGGRESFADLNGNLDTPQRLDQLLARAGVTLPGRDRLAADLAAGRVSPAQALRAVAESNEASSRFYNRAFVAMQYFGYLQRDPEPAGYQAWLNHLNANPNDYRTMIFGFLYSQEYQSRFGPVQ